MLQLVDTIHQDSQTGRILMIRILMKEILITMTRTLMARALVTRALMMNILMSHFDLGWEHKANIMSSDQSIVDGHDLVS
jgi:hypothetical protein